MVLSTEDKLALYRKMLLIRRMEEKHEQLLAAGQFWLMAHLGTGQEAIAIGITAPLKTDDLLFPTHRGVGEFIGKGMTPKRIWSEYFGRAAGPCKGKGTLHLADFTVGIPGLVGSLGADYAPAVGAALAAKMRNSGQVVLYYFGEGTSNQADFHPALNMASVWKLPIIFACVNNQYVELAHYRTVTATDDIAPRAAGYGIPWQIVEDGNDINAVYEATAPAVERARAGEGPSFIEYKTYRIPPHFSGDPGGYRPDEEVEAWKKKDPIARFAKELMEQGLTSQAQLDEINQSVVAEVEEAVAYAQALPFPAPEALFEDVYA